jgi:hypothetical protein
VVHRRAHAWREFYNRNQLGNQQSAPSTPFSSVVNGFRTEVEADGWIKFQRLRTKERDAAPPGQLPRPASLHRE